MRLHWLFLRREAQAGWRQLALFLICLSVASLAVASVSGWRQSIELAMARDARESLGGDVVAYSSLPFSRGLLAALKPYRQATILTQELYTVAVEPVTGRTLFSKLKAVQPGYPLYGQVRLASGRPLQAALAEGVVVEQRLLERLQMRVGSHLKVGNSSLLIADVVLLEPDRPLGLFAIAPRIFMAEPELAQTGLVQAGRSFVERRLHVRLDDPEQAQRLAERLEQAGVADQERVQTWKQPPAGLRRFIRNFFLYLDLVVAFTVLLSGLGMQSALDTWMRGRRPTLATLKVMGCNAGWLGRHYGTLVAALTVLGISLGLVGAALLLFASGDWLAQLLPGKVAPRLTPAASLQAAALAALVSAAFTWLPLRRLREVRPAQVLLPQPPPARLLVRSLALAWLAVFGLLWFMLGQAGRAGACSLSMVGGLLLVHGCARLLFGVLRRWQPRSLAGRVGLAHLLVPEANSAMLVTSWAASLTVLFSLSLCQDALRQAWLEALPPDAPNLLFFDIQPQQAEAFRTHFGRPIQLYSSLRVRVQAVDGQALERTQPREPGERDGRRELRGGTLKGLDPDERLVGAATLFQGSEPAQASLLDSLANTLKLRVGSRLSLTVQGVPLEVRVSSLRHVVRDNFRPTFDVLFPAPLVEGAPQSVFATARVAENQIGPLQARMAAAFPHVTSIDLSDSVRQLGVKLSQLVSLVRALLGLALVPGLVLLLSAALGNRLRRQREVASLKVVGAKRSFVLSVLFWENALLGGLCSALALGLALVISWGLCVYLFEVEFQPPVRSWLPMLISPALAICGLGWLLAQPVARARPAPYLASQP